MISPVRSVSRFAVAAAALGIVVPMAMGDERPGPDIRRAHRIQFSPDTNTAWMVEGADASGTWRDVAGPFFGRGSTVDHFVSESTAARQFRLRYVDPATIGAAPAAIGGTTVLMENGGQRMEAVFLDGQNGFLRIDNDHARTFRYTWSKTSPDGGEALLTDRNGLITLLRLQFATGHLGRWGMEDIPTVAAAAGVSETRDSGGFAWQQGRIRRDAKHAKVPLSLIGQSLLLNESGRHSVLTFTTSGVTVKSEVTEYSGDYSYDPEDTARGSLHIHLHGGRQLALKMEMLAPGLGRFAEQLAPGAAGPARNGTVTFPEQPEAPDNPDCPPAGLSGVSLVINDSAPCTLTFNANGTGMQTKEVNGVLQVIPFTYSYSRSGGNTASVTVTFPGASGDLVDDYDLEFDANCAGSFQRQSFTGGQASGNKGGKFSPGGLAGARAVR